MGKRSPSPAHLDVGRSTLYRALQPDDDTTPPVT
jgi:hypothetical protein